jgi:U3 small nucleolar RNA-associated protein 22
MKRKNSVVDRETEEEEKASKQKISSLAELESEDEDEEMDGISEEGEGESGAEEESSDDEEDTATHNKPTKKGLSAEEVQVARETSELFKSNIFKMQIDELMGELKLDPKQVQIVNKALHQTNNAIEGISDKVRSYNLVEAEKMFGKNCKDKIVIPFPDPKPSKDVQYKFGFAKPDYITVLGSFSLHTAVKQPEGVGIDLYVNMPDDLFQAKDYLNYRYIHKRAFYLACLAREVKPSLEKMDPPMEMSYSYLNEDLLRPVLQLTVANSTKKKHKFHINILPGASPTTFEPRKLGPDRNCVRLDREDTSTLPATVLYNSSVLSDTSYRAYSEFLHRAKRMCEGFNEACILGRLWLRQRGFGSSIRNGGFGHFEWAMLMAALLNGSGNQRVLMAGYSSYQLFKATVRFLATQKTALSVSFSTQKDQHTKANDKNLDFSSPAKLFDRDFKLNLLWKMSAWSSNLLKHEAAVTCDLLTDVVKDRFDTVLLKNITNPHLHFDTVFR